MSIIRILVTLAVALSIVGQARAQQSPLLPDTVYRLLVNEISGDIALEHIRWFTHYHRPMGGSEGYQAVERYVEQKAREFGLEDVRVIRLKGDTTAWNATVGELWLVEPELRRLAYSKEVPLALADYSRSADISSAELVDVGDGTSPDDYAGKPVAGKIVLASGSLARVMDEAVWQRGALGIVAFTTNRVPDYPDQYPWMRIPVESNDKTRKGTFAFVLQNREGEKLRRQLRASKTPFTVRVKIESSWPESSQSIVEAVIRGTEIHDQDVVLTGHLQEEMHSANDDASGCANVLEIARALKKLIDEGRLPRPRRDVRFWWLDEISASEQYFADRPDEPRQLLANINQDMVGARQSAGSRVQFVTRPPFSRASFLGDVVESIVGALVDGNTSYLAAGQARQVRQGAAQIASATTEDLPFSAPVLSRLGTREPYDARVIPFHNSTDHQVFNMGIIGVPGVTFTNWPDQFIHSSDDDLWQIDATQLKRNAVAVAASTLYLANAADGQVPALLATMYGAALERMSRDARTAMEMLGACAPGVTAEPAGERCYARAANVGREAAARERRALESVSAFVAEGGAGERALAQVLQQLPTPANAETRLAAFYAAARGQKPPAVTPPAAEKDAASNVPGLEVTIQQFLDRRSKIDRPRSLHSLMAYEVMNFVDGHRSVLDIYHAVSAEADAAGDWYYGTVRLEDVAAYLESAEKAGILTIKTRTEKSSR